MPSLPGHTVTEDPRRPGWYIATPDDGRGRPIEGASQEALTEQHHHLLYARISRPKAT